MGTCCWRKRNFGVLWCVLNCLKAGYGVCFQLCMVLCYTLCTDNFHGGRSSFGCMLLVVTEKQSIDWLGDEEPRPVPPLCVAHRGVCDVVYE